jgi:hypothetical protein
LEIQGAPSALTWVIRRERRRPRAWKKQLSVFSSLPSAAQTRRPGVVVDHLCGAKTRCDLASGCMEPDEVRRQLLMIAWRYLRLEAGQTPAIPSLLMLFASLYALVRLMLEVLVIRSRSEAERVCGAKTPSTASGRPDGASLAP